MIIKAGTTKAHMRPVFIDNQHLHKHMYNNK